MPKQTNKKEPAEEEKKETKQKLKAVPQKIKTVPEKETPKQTEEQTEKKKRASSTKNRKKQETETSKKETQKVHAPETKNKQTEETSKRKPKENQKKSKNIEANQKVKKEEIANLSFKDTQTKEHTQKTTTTKPKEKQKSTKSTKTSGHVKKEETDSLPSKNTHSKRNKNERDTAKEKQKKTEETKNIHAEEKKAGIVEDTHKLETADELISVPEEELKVVQEERKANKKLTNEQKEILKKNAFHNFFAAIGMTAYFILLTLAFERMKPEVFTLDLKVFSGTFLATAILLFEAAYKKEEGKWAIHGIEVLVIAIITLLLTHIYEIATGRFTTITLVLTGSSIAYYCIKCLVMVIQQIRKSKLQDMKKLLVEKSETDTKERMEEK